ncbi:Ken-052 [Symbiodinium sp. CCMP2456]|nr:Ken-052 [Symbiodinium sp. CCMP2456]
MGKFRVSKKGDNPFALPKRKVPKKQLPGESEANRRKKEEIRQKEAEAKAAREKRKAEEAARPPGKKLGPGFRGLGKARLQKMVKEGKVTKTDQDVEELLQCKDEVVCALADVQDEAKGQELEAGAEEMSFDEAFMERMRSLAQEALTWPFLDERQRLVWAAVLEFDAVPAQNLPPWFYERQNISRRCGSLQPGRKAGGPMPGRECHPQGCQEVSANSEMCKRGCSVHLLDVPRLQDHQ